MGREVCGFTSATPSAAFTCWREGGCANRGLKAAEGGLPQEGKDTYLWVFCCTLYVCPFEACQKGHEVEHFGFEQINKDWLLFDHFIFLLKELSSSLLLVPVLSHVLC